MIIRNATKKDIADCLKITKFEKDKYWNKKDFSRSINHRDVIFLVAEEKDKVIGYILGFIAPTKKDDGMISETRVNVKYRKKGLGTKLVNAICNEMFKKGVKEVYAEIDPPLLKFYRDSCKFKETHKWIEVSKKK